MVDTARSGLIQPSDRHDDDRQCQNSTKQTDKRLIPIVDPWPISSESQSDQANLANMKRDDIPEKTEYRVEHGTAPSTASGSPLSQESPASV
jgi:hypothetical protein